jgi:vacuolar-type H+-ATPase subunit C/Vma6
MLTGKTLDQILGVIESTAYYHESGLPIPKAYQKSVKDIAHKYSVRYQTIADGCRRRLNLDNVDEFMKLLNEWLKGDPSRLKELLITNIGELDEDKVEKFFNMNSNPSSVVSESARNVEETFTVITFKAHRDLVSQLRTLAEAEGKSVQEFMNIISKKYVDSHYMEFVKNLINSLPAGHKEKVIAELAGSFKKK